ncbi:MAG TPA: phosphoadenylyl-sulfate reductase [Blastocatellia bacterium]|nr:phosphoadenylyl-sulfate reductase [Blastocatellia bacterium]
MSQSAVALRSAGWIEDAAEELEEAHAEEIIRWALNEFDDGLTVATGFGVEGMVLVDLAARVGSNLDVFFLDTGFLFPETYELRRRIEQRYGIVVRSYQPDLTPEDQARIHGESLWLKDPDLCCRLRKLDPLERALAGRTAWMTAIRRDQTAARKSARVVEWDHRWGLIKVNPLAAWTREQIWRHVYENDVPYNPLHDQGYPSIGCTHCTRAVRPGEDERSGRWAGTVKTECGLHAPAVAPLRLVSLSGGLRQEDQASLTSSTLLGD